MSQTATMPFGFSADPMVAAYVEGHFGETVLRASDIASPGSAAAVAAERYAETLRGLVPGLPTVCFAASGAEANEKAFALCRAHGPAGAHRVLAFDGSFHGRTLLALYASHSPGKRVPFELKGFEATFAPWPLWRTPGTEPDEPEGWRALCAAADAEGLRACFAAGDDALLAAEAASLAEVIEVLRRGEHFAVVLEPMQSEGGDRYVTARFHRGLRLVTRRLGVPQIMDEVQCGFGLGGSFAWHHRFHLVDSEGRPDSPDCVVFAKRAQVGVVMSRFPDPEPTQAYAASLVHGRMHASWLAASEAACEVEGFVRAHLPDLERRWGHRIGHPRVTGFAFAFDLASPAELDAYLGQRFWRGAIVFGAGDRTVRYRLQATFTEADVALLFRTIHQSLAWLEAHPGKKPPEWEDLEVAASAKEGASEIRVRRADASEADAVLPLLLALEARVYEPARQDPPERLRLGFDDPDGAAVLAERKDAEGWTLVGYAISAPLERLPGVAGPDSDPARGRHDTAYSIALTVDPSLQGAGLGRRLKRAQLEAARDARRSDGTPRFRWMTGRNRLGLADVMVRLNDSFGAFTSRVLHDQYGEEGSARYYRQPVGPLHVDGGVRVEDPATVDVSGGLAAPFAAPLESLVRAEQQGLLWGPTINKLTLVNYVTPALVRAVEYAAALSPDLPHVFLTSGRDEANDKAIRLLRWHRKQGQRVLSFAGAYVGHTTAASRSVSCATTHAQGPSHFGWPHLPHPEDVGEEAAEAALRAAIADGGAASVLGVMVEAIQERTGRVISPSFAARLGALRDETGIPIVVVDTAGAYHRSGRGAFASDAWGITPDVRTWWTGGQLGLLHVSRALYVPTPLTFVSTWDGDELSLLQMHHQLRASRHAAVHEGAEALDEALSAARRAGMTVRGCGLYRVLDAGPRAPMLVQGLAERGLHARAFANGHVAFAPSLDRAVQDAQTLGAALRAILTR